MLDRMKTDLLTNLARAKTGSGKTAAYVLPILQAILLQKTVSTFFLLSLGLWSSR
jgi:superfamily II DNA/RNA helicase